MNTTPLAYEGLVTRAIAFAVDAAIIDLIALVVGVGLGLALSILSISDDLLHEGMDVLEESFTAAVG